MAMDPAAMAAAIRQTAQGFGPHVNWLNKPTPSIHSILEQMFNLAHSEWAREFLFFPNPHVDAGILTSALNLQYKVAGQIKLDVKADRVGPYTNSFIDRSKDEFAPDDQLYCDWVIVPAFNFGQQGACYFMQKTASGPAQDHNGAMRSALYRIVTDDVTGEVLYVGDMPETDTFQVVHMTHLNGAYHQRAMCFLEGSVFRSALTADNGRMSIPHMAKALVMCIHTRETRNCKTCGAHPSMCCNCPVSLRLSEHPHDLRFYAHNARAHLGHYAGKEKVMYLKKGNIVATKTHYTLHRTNTDTDSDTVSSLREWAVRDRLGAVIQRSFGRYIQRPPISSVAVASAIMNLNKSFDEVIDVLAECDNPNMAAHRHYTQGQGQGQSGSYSSMVPARRPTRQTRGNSQGYPMVTDGGEMDISQPVLPQHNVNDPMAISNLGANCNDLSGEDIQQMRVLHQTRSRAEEVQLAEQLALEQQRLEREHQMEQLHLLEERRRAVQQRQLVEQQELLQQRELIQRQGQLALRKCLVEGQQQQVVTIQRRQAVHQQQLAQQQAFEQSDLAQQQRAMEQQQVAAQMRELCQRQQQLIQQREGQLQDANMTSAVAVHDMTANTSALDAAQIQRFTPSARHSLGTCKDDVVQGHANSILPGNASQAMVNSQDAISNAAVNTSNSVYFGKRPRSDLVSNAHYVPPVPCSLSAEQIGAPIGTAQAAGITVPQPSIAASRGAAMYARSGMFRTEVGQSTMGGGGGGTGMLPGGWHNGKSMGRAVNIQIGQAQALRPAPTERRLLPRGSQPAPQPPEDPKRKRELDMRIRKREAARRSDARRLARVQQLQAQTNEMERTANELRAKQAKLLDENAILRRQVAALGTRVPTM